MKQYDCILNLSNILYNDDIISNKAVGNINIYDQTEDMKYFEGLLQTDDCKYVTMFGNIYPKENIVYGNYFIFYKNNNWYCPISEVNIIGMIDENNKINGELYSYINTYHIGTSYDKLSNFSLTMMNEKNIKSDKIHNQFIYIHNNSNRELEWYTNYHCRFDSSRNSYNIENAKTFLKK